MIEDRAIGMKRSALLGISLLTVCWVRILLLVASHRSVTRLMPAAAELDAPKSMAMRIASAVQRAARFVPAATCLTQALAVQFLLAARGYKSEVRVGVRHDDQGVFEAHAWLVSGSDVVIGGTSAEIVKYAQIATLTANRS